MHVKDYEIVEDEAGETPSDPADPSLMDKRADALFEYAVSVTGCQTPLIALNEL